MITEEQRKASFRLSEFTKTFMRGKTGPAFFSAISMTNFTTTVISSYWEVSAPKSLSDIFSLEFFGVNVPGIVLGLPVFAAFDVLAYLIHRKVITEARNHYGVDDDLIGMANDNQLDGFKYLPKADYFYGVALFLLFGGLTFITFTYILNCLLLLEHPLLILGGLLFAAPLSAGILGYILKSIGMKIDILNFVQVGFAFFSLGITVDLMQLLLELLPDGAPAWLSTATEIFLSAFNGGVGSEVPMIVSFKQSYNAYMEFLKKENSLDTFGSINNYGPTNRSNDGNRRDSSNYDYENFILN